MTEEAPKTRFEEFCDKFTELKNEAYDAGVDAVVIIRELDHFAGTEAKECGWSGGPVLAMGMCHWALSYLKETTATPEEQ